MSGFMDYITYLLPDTPGLLPKWHYLVATVAFTNALQAYTTTTYTARLYNLLPPSPGITPLQSRTFGTWTFLSGVVRLYGAFHMNEQVWYELVMWTYAIAAVHFGLEWAAYGTAGLGGPLKGPACVSLGTLGWMWWVREGYVGV